jgi:hypothetical protein
MGADGGGTAVFTGGTAVRAGCAGGVDGTGRVGASDAVGTAGAAWASCAGTAVGVEEVSADAVCTGTRAEGAGDAPWVCMAASLFGVGGEAPLNRDMEITSAQFTAEFRPATTRERQRGRR